MIDDILSNLQSLGQKQSQDQSFNDAVALSEYYLKIQSDLQKYTNEKNDLSLRLQNLKGGEAVAEMNLNEDELRKKILDLYLEKDKKESNIKEITKEIEQKSNEKQSLETELKSLTDKKESLSNSISSLENEINSLNSNKVDRQKEINDLMEQISSITQAVEKKKVDILNIKSKTQRVVQFINEAEKNISHRPLTHLHTKLTKFADSIITMEFSNHFDSFYTLGKEKKLIQWDLPSITEKRSVIVPGTPYSFRIYEETQIAAVSCDKSIQLIDVTTGRNQGQLTSHNDTCIDNFWISRSQLISSSKDRTVKIFDINRKQCISTISTATVVHSICQTADPVVFATAGFDGKIRLIDIRQKNIAKKIDKVHDRLITSILPSSSRDRYYTLSLDNTICETSAQTDTVVRKLAVPSENQQSSAPASSNPGDVAKIYIKDQGTKMSIDPTGGFLCTGTDCGVVLLFDLVQDGVIHELKEHKKPVLCSTMAANLLITADTGKTVAFWT